MFKVGEKYKIYKNITAEAGYVFQHENVGTNTSIKYLAMHEFFYSSNVTS